jgi:M6 family metalloprotease-like protein
MTIDSGSGFKISYSVSYNTTYILSISLKDPNCSSFVSVDDKGEITTNKIGEDKVVEIVIKATGSSGVLDEVYLKINLKKSEEIKDELIVYNKFNASEVKDGDTITIYKEQELSFDVLFNGESKTNVISVVDSNILQVNDDSNLIKGLKSGTSAVSFKYEEKTITITIKVINDTLISIEARNKGNDFVIINNKLHYLNNLIANYQSGNSKEIKNDVLVLISIVDKDDLYKTVTFTYKEDDNTTSVNYDIRFFEVEEYEGKETAYNNNDYYNNNYYGTAQVLPNNGNVKILVVPVWFNDSNVFFNTSQKEQILEDIEYTMNANRPNTELSSVKQYYEAQSYGAITMDIKVSDFYISNTSYKDYTDNNQNSKTNNDNILATDAISWYFENNKDEKFEDYDLNGDGYLDGIILLYGANYYGNESDANSSYAFESTNYGNEDYSYNTMSFCPIGGLYGLAKDKPTTQLTTLDLSKTFERDFKSSSRVIIHEMGHMFGNKDLYESASSNEKYLPAGGFLMQDNNCGGHDPLHVNMIGWSKPEIYASSDYELGDKLTIHLEDFQSSGQNVILTNTWNSSNSLFDEYLIIELFAPTGLNEFDAKGVYVKPIESGIRLWHANSSLIDYANDGNLTSEIISGHIYALASSNNDPENEYDTLHLIRNNPNEEYNTTSSVAYNDVLFEAGDSFDMETFKSQFINGDKLDNGDKLGWKFKVETIYKNIDGTYGAIITLERVENVKTDFVQTISLTRSDLNEPTGEEDYSTEIFGEDDAFTFKYKYVTPPSYYEAGYPISSKGMCLFAAANGDGGYIDLSINSIEGKEVCINSISITYSKLTNASLTVLADGNAVTGDKLDSIIDGTYVYEFDVNSSSVRIQNQYDGEINHWSVITILDITIDYTIK